MADNSQSELSYQPATKGYSFSTNPVAPAKPINKSKKQTSVFVLLFLEIAGLLIVFAIFLLILNFFNIISLPGFSHKQVSKTFQTAQLSGPTLDSKTGIWTVSGTFYGYNQYIIQVINNNNVLNFQWLTNTSKAFIYDSPDDLSNPNYASAPLTLFDIEQDQFLGKNVTLMYKVKDGLNTISNLNLFKQ